MKYLLEGEAHELAKILQENRIRVQRGLIKITPFEPKEENKEENPVTDSKEPPLPDSKEVKAETSKKTRTKKSE